MSRAYFKKINILGSINPLPSSLIFDFTVGKNDIAHMDKSFFVLKTKFTRAANAIINDDSYRVFNYPANLFSTVREKLNGSTYCLTNNYGQADTIIKRNNYSQKYLETTGALMGLDSNASRIAEARAYKSVDAVFVPSAMALWNIENEEKKGVLQSGSNVRLEMDVNTNYVSACTVALTANSIFTVEDFYLMLYTEENSQSYIQNSSYVYKMRESKVELYPFSGSSVNRNINVEPSVEQIIYTFQTGAVPSIFQVPSYLTNHYLDFNGQNYPNNQHNLKEVANTEKTGWKLAVFMNLIQNGLISNVAGYEGNDLDNAYGKLFLNEVEKSASAVATSANIICNFTPPEGDANQRNLVSLSNNTFDLLVNYDAFGNVSGVPVKTIV